MRRTLSFLIAAAVTALGAALAPRTSPPAPESPRAAAATGSHPTPSDPHPALPTPTTPSAGAAESGNAAGPQDRAALEKSFEQTLSHAVLRGTWQMTGAEGVAGKAALGEPSSDRYAIGEVEKVGDDQWLINARIQYASKDVTIPVMVKVLWAGDTPVITLDNVGLPGLGTYSARVMIHRGFYSGTWFGKDYGGVMSGQIVREADEPRPGATTRPASTAATRP